MAALRLFVFVWLCAGSAYAATAQTVPSDSVTIRSQSGNKSSGSVLGWSLAGLVGFALGFGAARLADDTKVTVRELSRENETLREKAKELRQRLENEKWKLKPDPSLAASSNPSDAPAATPDGGA